MTPRLSRLLKGLLTDGGASEDDAALSRLFTGLLPPF
jgi:hypothetical protein